MWEVLGWIVGGGALSAVAAELAVRAVHRRRGAAWPMEPNSEIRLEIDREALPALEPVARFRVNADGERGDPLPHDWRETYRVIVAGGSAAECFYLDQDTQWPAVVQRELQREAALLGVQHVHVGNIARSMQRCEYVAWMLEKMLPRLPRLDAVVLMVGASDLVMWMQEGCPPTIPAAARPDPSYCFQQHDYGPYGWSPSKLALREALKRLKNRFAPSVLVRPRAGKSFAKNRAARQRAKKLTESPDRGAMLAHYELWLRRTIEAARATGARVLVARQPWLQRDFTPEEEAFEWNFGMGRPYQENVETYFDLRLVHRLLAEVDAVSARVADELGVEAFDLRARLEPTFEVFYDTLHNTPRGCEDVGRLVAEALLAPLRRGPGGAVHQPEARAVARPGNGPVRG